MEPLHLVVIGALVLPGLVLLVVGLFERPSKNAPPGVYRGGARPRRGYTAVDTPGHDKPKGTSRARTQGPDSP